MKSIAILALTGAAFVVASCQQQQVQPGPADNAPQISVSTAKK